MALGDLFTPIELVQRVCVAGAKFLYRLLDAHRKAISTLHCGYVSMETAVACYCEWHAVPRLAEGVWCRCDLRAKVAAIFRKTSAVAADTWAAPGGARLPCFLSCAE